MYASIIKALRYGFALFEAHLEGVVTGGRYHRMVDADDMNAALMLLVLSDVLLENLMNPMRKRLDALVTMMRETTQPYEGSGPAPERLVNFELGSEMQIRDMNQGGEGKFVCFCHES